MADWPDADELKQIVDVTSDDFDATLDRVMAAAIDRVKRDVGGVGTDNAWDEYEDAPDEMLAQAALRMGELLALRPESAEAASRDPTYRRLLFGHRRTFGIS